MLHNRVSGAVTLLVLSISLAIAPVSKAQEGIDRSAVEFSFTPDSPFKSDIEISVICGNHTPLSIYAGTSSGKRKAIDFQVDGNRISTVLPSIPVSSLYLILEGPEVTGEKLIVMQGGRTVPGRWQDISDLLLGDIADVTDSLSFATVAVADTHRVGFNTTTTPLSDSGVIWVTLPNGFTIGPISDTAYFDDDPANDGNEPVIRSVTTVGRTLKFHLSGGTQPAAVGSRISVRFAYVTSDTVAGQYVVVVMSTDHDEYIDNGPAVSSPFELYPDVIDHIDISPVDPISVPSDSVVNFDVTALDRYNNVLSGQVFTYGVTVDSCGETFGSNFRALKIGDCYFTASSGGIIDSSGLLTVVPGDLDHFSISGYPTQTSAGIPFIPPVNVTAFDIHGNIKTDYTGSVWFTSTDPNPNLPYESGNPYTFTLVDAGSHNFPGLGFILRTSGLRIITVTDGAISKTSNYIDVIPGPIVSFTMTAISPQIAGESFQLQASSAEDSLGNLASGEIIVADSVGGGSSPDGIPPSLNRIIVTDGNGSAFQTLTNAVPTILKGTVSGTFAVAATDTIRVIPGNLDRFEISGYPDSSVAGVSFPDPGISVSVFDLFGNLKINYVDSVYFTSSDLQADLPYTLASKYGFQVADSGSHTFPGSDFTLKTAGYNDITITDGTISDISEPITVVSNIINTFALTAPLSVTAGNSFPVFATNCRDAWLNLAGGTIIISDSIGGGDSPNGTSPVFNSITVIHGTGSADQTLVNVDSTVLKGEVFGGTAVNVTDTIAVNPGRVGKLDLAGYPLSITAGNFFPDPGVRVDVYDYYGNLKIDCADSVYFTCSDNQAFLPYNRLSKYVFQPADSGSHTFPGSGFIMFTAGNQVLTVTDSVFADSSSIITVNPGPVNSFTIYTTDTVAAGVAFPVNVSQCVDAWMNPTNANIAIIDSVGGGNSPDGSSPVFNSIRVISGSGSANQTLVNAVTTVLRGRSANNVVAVTDSIAVMPGIVEDFHLNVSSPQYSGSPFAGTALVSAYDYYGNLKTNYDASADTVVISSSGGGTMQNNILRLPGDFIDGVADLAALGTEYDGRGGNMTFSALSESGAGGTSNQVDMRAVFCGSFLLDQGVLSWGDTATGVISVTNDGGIAVEITELSVLSESGIIFNTSSTVPPLPDSLRRAMTRNYDIWIPINPGVQEGVYPLTAAVRGLFGLNMVRDTLSGFPDTLKIEHASYVTYVAGSISRDTLSTGQTYSLSLRLGNIGDAGIGLIDTSYLYFTDGVRTFRANILNGIYLSPNNPQGTVVQLDSTLVDPGFIDGDYAAKFYVFGQENGHFVVDSLDISDIITIQQYASINYIAGSMNIDTLVAGQSAAFNIGVTNAGSAAFAVDHENTALRFSDSQRVFEAYSDTASGNRVDYINPGDTVLYFAPEALSDYFSPGDYRPAVTLRGVQNGISQTVVFNTGSDSVTVISRGSLRVDSTYVMSLNAPFVDTSQPCSVKVVISNSGEEAVDSVYVQLSSDGNSSFADSLYLGYIDAHSQGIFHYPVTAGTIPNSGEVFVSSTSGGVGVRSGLSPLIRTPLDNGAILIIELPASLAVMPISVTWPPGAMNDTVTIGQDITISTLVRNQGQAGIGGVQSLELDPGNSGFTIADSATRDYELDQNVYWTIMAPSTPNNSAILTVRFAALPRDINDNSSAVGPDSVMTIELVVNTRPAITQVPVLDSPAGAVDGILSTNQMFLVADTISAYGDYRDLSVTLTLPFGYATDDSLTKFPSGNVVSWNVRAPVDVGVDSLVVRAALYDRNSGEEIAAGPDYIRVETVEGARLNLGTRVSGPPAALDDIIEPGAYLEYEALVINDGQADVGTGRLSLHIGHPDLVTTDQLVMPFTPGTPIIWTITAPANEISSAVPIWVTLDSIPDDENSNHPAFVISDSSTVYISVRELLPRLDFAGYTGHSGSVVRGQTLNYLTFVLRNNDRGGSFPIEITTAKITISSAGGGPDTEVQGVIAGASLFSDTTEIGTGIINGNEITFDVSGLILEPGTTADIVLRLTISSSTLASNFALSIADGDIGGAVIDNGVPVGNILARSTGGTALWEGVPTAILEQSFAASISSYPNPFNPRKTSAKIGYYLESDSDLNVKIFTLLGELVWSADIAASEPLGRAGLHTGDTALIWDGKNNSGYEIHSGVYICLIKNIRTGQEERFKIAVVK